MRTGFVRQWPALTGNTPTDRRYRKYDEPNYAEHQEEILKNKAGFAARSDVVQCGVVDQDYCDRNHADQFWKTAEHMSGVYQTMVRASIYRNGIGRFVMRKPERAVVFSHAGKTSNEAVSKSVALSGGSRLATGVHLLIVEREVKHKVDRSSEIRKPAGLPQRLLKQVCCVEGPSELLP